MHIYIYIHTHACIYKYALTHTHIYIYIYIYSVRSVNAVLVLCNPVSQSLMTKLVPSVSLSCGEDC